ncbi:unnamed protein product [Closterium sp. NIES-53]
MTGYCTARVNDNTIALPRWGSPKSSSVLVNAITMKRVIAAGADVYAVDIREAEAADKGGDLQKLIADVPDDLGAQLKQYSGIFLDDLPIALPPQRPHDHRIELEPGFDTWLDDLQLYLLSDSRDSVSLFDHTSGASIAPPVTADNATRSQWLTRDASAHLAVRNHLPLAERAHFGQHKTAKAVYEAFATVEDLITHLPTNDTCYHAALTTEFLDKNPPPMYITLYFIVTRLPDSLRAVMDNFLALDPTDLTVDLFEKHLLAAEPSVVAVGAARGTPCTPFFERCSPSPLAPSYASATAVDILGTEDVGAAYALSGKRRNGKSKGGKSGGGGSGGGGGGGGGGDGSGGGSGGGVGGFGGGGGGSGGSGGGGGGGSGSGGGGSGGGRGGAVQRGGSSGGQRQQQQRQSETPTPQQLCEWFAQRGASGGSVLCLSVIPTGPTTNFFFLPYPKCILRLPHPAVATPDAVAAPTAIAAPAVVAAPAADVAPAAERPLLP